MLNFRQIQAFVAVYEDRSFSHAAVRTNSTQSGLSMQVSRLEALLKLRLFERTPKGVLPTPAGDRLYRRATNILRDISEAEAELHTLAGEISGRIRIGLMPAFTHAVLAATLKGFVTSYPNVDVTIVGGYSPELSASTARGDFDFAIVPADQNHSGLRARPFGSALEMLMSGPLSGLRHLEPVQLATLPPLKLVLPTHGNARRARLETYFIVNAVSVASILEMDAMSATLEYVASTDWMTILPATICVNDIAGTVRRLNPIIAPEARVDYVLVEPLRRALSPSATMFMEALKNCFDALNESWNDVLSAQ